METYTLVGAADWPMLSIIGGFAFFVLQAIVLMLVATVYKALPKHKDLENLRQNVNLDIEKLAKRLEMILEKYIIREESARTKQDDDLWLRVQEGRETCQRENARRFEELSNEIKNLRS